MSKDKEEVKNSESFLKLKAIVAAAEEDDQKFAKGNVAAGTRLRAFMQDIKKAATELRADVLVARKKE